ncbi:hypothetical protein Tco_0375162 [Tanacetum coccineum]
MITNNNNRTRGRTLTELMPQSLVRRNLTEDPNLCAQNATITMMGNVLQNATSATGLAIWPVTIGVLQIPTLLTTKRALGQNLIGCENDIFAFDDTIRLDMFQLKKSTNIIESRKIEDSTITYSEVSSPFEDLFDIGSSGVDGLPMILEDPYVEAALQAPPSHDYVPGPEHPPLPVYVPYVPEPVYPEFMPPEDDVLPAEEQPLPAAVSPTADSPGYITESDLEEDLEEDDEDPADYPTNKDNGEEEEEESSGDDADDEEEDKDEEEEEDEEEE